MRKIFIFFIGACICATMYLTACMSEMATGLISEEESTKVYYEDYIADDFKSLKNALTVEYDIHDLEEFFLNASQSEYPLNKDEYRSISFTEVDERFPLEVIRTQDYSVYKVAQGGYFYVFWNRAYIADVATESIEPTVYFTAYLSSARDKKIFNDLKRGVSTAEDVKAIDPSFQLNFWKSNGRYSYSYLNENKVLEIRYMDQSEMMDYEDLVVDKMKVVSRQDASTNFRAILSKDLPRE